MPVEINGEYGRLIVLEETDQRVRGSKVFRCLCSCGNEAFVASPFLMGGNTKSCGCIRKEMAQTKVLNHGHSRIGKETPTHISWRGMKDRCNNPNARKYALYGGRGISYDPRWESFNNFLEDMGERPKDMTIDRIDPDGNYCKENCKWSTITEQNGNLSLRSDNSTGYKGVRFDRRRGKYYSTFNKKFLGYYPTAIEAYSVYLEAKEAMQ